MANVMMPVARWMLLTCALAGVLAGPALAAVVAPSAAVTAASSVAPAAATRMGSNSVTNARQETLFRRLWGIDEIHVRSTASGALVRFSYRVVDAEKAKILNSKQSTPYLIDEQHGLALQVPVMDQVGQLRQVPTPQNGRDYWMAFSNKGRYVKSGSHVTLIIGSSRFNGLVVE